MRAFRPMFLFLISLFGLAAVPAHGETFHTCATIIASLPTVISTQGVYCLNHDLTTAITSGNAIDIQTNNVTIDCNGYKIGGLAAGAGSLTLGINAINRQNIAVRNCGIRGFFEAVKIAGGAGHLVEDNRFDNNLYIGMYLAGDNNRVRRNAVYDTGGATGKTESAGLSIQAEATDNTVAGLFAGGASPFTVGISMFGAGTEARGNQISLQTIGAGTAEGILVTANAVTVRDNSIAATSFNSGVGIDGISSTDTICIGNSVHKFFAAIVNCQNGGGNASN